MDLTPRDIHDRRFHDAFRGYNQEEVDLFLDEVAASFEKVFRENQTFHHRLKELESQLSEARATEDMLKQMLLAAQKTANDAVEAARAQAEDLIAQASSRASGIVAEDEARAAEIVNQAVARQREAAATVESLRAFDRQHRERLRSFMDSQLRALSDLAVFSPPPEEPAFGVDTVEPAASSEGTSSHDPAAPRLREEEPRHTEPTAVGINDAAVVAAEPPPAAGFPVVTGTTVAPDADIEGGDGAGVPPAQQSGLEVSSQTQAYVSVDDDQEGLLAHPSGSHPISETIQGDQPGKEPEQTRKPAQDEELSIDELFWGERKR